MTRMTSRTILALTAALLSGCPGTPVPCGENLCPAGNLCVSLLYDGPPTFCAETYGPDCEAVTAFDGEDPVAVCPFGTSAEGAACEDSRECLSGLNCSLRGICSTACSDSTGLPIATCWDGSLCSTWTRTCEPRCDLPDAAPCPASTGCVLGQCRGFGGWGPFFRIPCTAPPPPSDPYGWPCPTSFCVGDRCLSEDELLEDSLDCDGDGLGDCWRPTQYCLPEGGCGPRAI